MTDLHDPVALRDREDVEYRTEAVDATEGECDYFAEIAGMAAVGVTSEDGVLLMESPHGWRLPYGPVQPDEDWFAVGERIASALTGRDATIAGVERANRITHRFDGRDATTHDLVLRADAIPERSTAADPSFGPWDDLTVDWFDRVPEDAYHDHEDAVSDIRVFLG